MDQHRERHDFHRVVGHVLTDAKSVRFNRVLVWLWCIAGIHVFVPVAQTLSLRGSAVERVLIFDRRAFAVLRSTYSWRRRRHRVVVEDRSVAPVW